MSQSSKSLRSLTLFAIKATISGVLIYVALSRLNLTHVDARLSSLQPFWILSALLVAAFQSVLLAYRWQIIARFCQLPMKDMEAIRFFYIGLFFSQFLPGGFGGDAIRIWLLGRAHSDLVGASYSVLLDRFFGLLSLTLFVIGGLGWSLAQIPDAHARTSLLLLSASCFAVAVMFLFASQLLPKRLAQWMVFRHLGEMSHLAKSMLVSRRGPSIMVLSLIIHAIAVVMAWLLAKAIGTPFSILSSFEFVPAVMLITLLPISISGWGVREMMFSLVFRYIGLPEGDGVIVSLLLGGIGLVLAACGCVLWLTNRVPVPKSLPSR